MIRLQSLIEKYELNPNLLEYLKDDRLYYSYVTAGGFIGSIDTITYNPKYDAMVRTFEKKNNIFVYHVIETQLKFGNENIVLLNLLYVSRDENEWEMNRLYGNNISAFVIPMNRPSEFEVGDIGLSSFVSIGDYKTLIRSF